MGKRYFHEIHTLKWSACNLLIKCEDKLHTLEQPNNKYRKYLVEECLPHIQFNFEDSEKMKDYSHLIQLSILYHLTTTQFSRLYYLLWRFSQTPNCKHLFSEEPPVEGEGLSVQQRQQLFEKINQIPKQNIQPVDEMITFFTTLSLFLHTAWEYLTIMIYNGTHKKALVKSAPMTEEVREVQKKRKLNPEAEFGTSTVEVEQGNYRLDSV